MIQLSTHTYLYIYIYIDINTHISVYTCRSSRPTLQTLENPGLVSLPWDVAEPMTTKVGASAVASAVASARAMTSRFKGNDMCLFGPMAPKEWVRTVRVSTCFNKSSSHQISHGFYWIKVMKVIKD